MIGPPRKPGDLVERRVLVVATGSHSVEETSALLVRKGFKLDHAFPAIVVDPPTGRFVLRGTASQLVVDALSAESDLEVFPDLDVSS